MRKLVGVLVVVLVAGGLAGVAAPAGASVAGRNAKFCNAWSKVGSSGPDSTSTIGAQAKALAKDYRKIAKTTSGSVAKAFKTTASYLDQLAKLKSNKALQDFALRSASQYQKFLTAQAKIGTYVIKNCTA